MNKKLNTHPFVSIIMPIRNEEDFIEKTIISVCNQDYPKERMEIIVVDGDSNDKTPLLLEGLASKDNRLIVLTNPKQIVSSGLNLAIKKSKGDILIRVDGHLELDIQFIRNNIKLLDDHPEAWCVGGPIVHAGRNVFAKGLAFTMSSSLGVGNANHRKEGYKGYAEGAVFPAMRKEIFQKVGLFDEEFVRNQDDEFNFRVIQAGGKIFIDPCISHQYFVREKPSQLWNQYLQYGYWKVLFWRKHKKTASVRHLVPAFFVATLITFSFASLISSLAMKLFSFLIIIYCSLIVLQIMMSFIKLKNIIVSLNSGISVFLIHISYGCGTIIGIFNQILSSKKIEQKFKGISR